MPATEPANKANKLRIKVNKPMADEMPVKKEGGGPFLSFEKVYLAFRLYFSHLIFVSIAKLIYDFLPFYQKFLSLETRRVFAFVYLGYILLAPVYYVLAFSFGWLTERDLETSKSTLMLRYLKKFPSIFKHYISLGFTGTFPPELALDRPTHVAFLAFLVKFFFIPIMTNFLFVHINSLTFLFTHSPAKNTPLFFWFFDWFYWVVYNFIFVIDVGVFVFAYASEAKWLGNQIKSVEPTVFGWAVAIGCYPPFNELAARYLPTDHMGPAAITSVPVLTAFKIIVLLLFLIYVWATVSLMTKSGNLVNRGIVTKGAYGVIRHPAYISKCTAWWFEKLPYILFDYHAIVFLLCWNFIYFLRAITEEKHLLATDPAYAEYCKKVRYRFIPGVF